MFLTAFQTGFTKSVETRQDLRIRERLMAYPTLGVQMVPAATEAAAANGGGGRNGSWRVAQRLVIDLINQRPKRVGSS